MNTDAPPDNRPRRELVEPAKLVEQFGLLWLVLAVEVQAGVSKRTGEVHYKTKKTRYLVRDLGGQQYRLVTEHYDLDLKPVAYMVNRFGCDCPDAQFKGRERH